MPPITDVVKNLIIINVVVFIVVQLIPEQYSNLLALYPPTVSEYFRPHQLVTHMFIHANITHLLFNMLGLFFLGPIVEQSIGPKKFLTLYFISGIGAMLTHIAVAYAPYLLGGGEPLYNMFPVVGASGAVYGVVIGMAYLYPNMRLMLLFPPIPIRAKYMALALIVLGLFLGVTGRQAGVAHFAHLGGALFGFLTLFYWKKRGQLGKF